MGLEIEEEERKRRNDYELVPMCVMFSLSNDKVSASLIGKDKFIGSYLKGAIC